MPSLVDFIRRLRWLANDAYRWSRGQGLAEYALILGLVAIVAILALLFLGQTISGVVFEHIGGTIESHVN